MRFGVYAARFASRFLRCCSICAAQFSHVAMLWHPGARFGQSFGHRLMPLRFHAIAPNLMTNLQHHKRYHDDQPNGARRGEENPSDLATIIVCFLICSLGLQKGVERVTKYNR